MDRFFDKYMGKLSYFKSFDIFKFITKFINRFFDKDIDTKKDLKLV